MKKKEKYKIIMLCNRCGCDLVFFNPLETGGRCGRCGNQQFNHVVVPTK